MKKKLNLFSEIAMYLILLAQMLYVFTGTTVHEILGITFFVCLIIHVVNKRWWFKAVLTGKSRKTRFSLELEKHAIQTDGQVFPFSGISDIAMVKTNRLLFSAPDGYYEIRSEKGILRPYLLAVQNDGKETENQ